MSSSLQGFSQGAEDTDKENPSFRSFNQTLLPFYSFIPGATELPMGQDIPSQVAVNEAGHVLPISAPVPVWCASLGKDALRSILEMRHGENTTEESQAHIFSENGRTKENQPQGQLFPWSSNLTHEQNGDATERKMVIRPITPSTLIALTEPCLMGWCFTDAEENPDPNNNGFGETSPEPEQTSHDLIQGDFYAHLDQTGRMTNEWGY